IMDVDDAGGLQLPGEDGRLGLIQMHDVHAVAPISHLSGEPTGLEVAARMPEPFELRVHPAASSRHLDELDVEVARHVDGRAPLRDGGDRLDSDPVLEETADQTEGALTRRSPLELRSLRENEERSHAPGTHTDVIAAGTLCAARWRPEGATRVGSGVRPGRVAQRPEGNAHSSASPRRARVTPTVRARRVPGAYRHQRGAGAHASSRVPAPGRGSEA